MLERELENKLKRAVLDRGGLALKFVSPGLAGVPDRLILLPGARIAFAELKAPGQKLRPLQRILKRVLEDMGFDYWVIDAKEKTDRFIRQYFGR